MKNADMPAAPIVLSDGEVWSEESGHAHGLTKREHFAALAMQGLCSSIEWTYDACPEGETPGKWIAEQSVAMADVLLAALEDES